MKKYFNYRGLVLDSADNFTTDEIKPTDYSVMREHMSEYAKLKAGKNVLTDPIFVLDYFGDFHRMNKRCADKRAVLEALHRQDLPRLREISDFFYNTSGIYSRLCRYMAYLYRYDWLITPYINDDSLKTEKILSDFTKALKIMDDFKVKQTMLEIALKVVRYGVYYGYKVWKGGKVTIQELPIRYCRTRMKNMDGEPIVEFNMRFFDEQFRNAQQRQRILKLFPSDFLEGYRAYKNNQLPPMFEGDTGGWWILDDSCAFKFNLNGSDCPAFISVIPAIIDLDNAQGIDRQRMAQRILKILIQKMPIDKNGDMIFDPDEALELHRNAVAMVGSALGIEILTTYADVDVEDMDSDTTNSTDELEKVERAIFNESGVSQMQFNTDGNIALEKSILNDEACMYNLVLQFEVFLNSLLKPVNTKPKRIEYKLQLLSTTIYNYKDMADKYKALTQMGYSKMLPAIALGESQSSILANAHFENEILELYNVFIPPITSNVMSGDMISPKGNSGTASSDKGGRPEKSDDEKAEKTIQNRESMS